MAYYRKVGKTWKVEIARRGVKRSQSGFATKAAAQAWAHPIEAGILGGARGDIPDLAFSDLLDKYETDVSAGKKGYRWESVRIALFKRDTLAQVRLRKLDATHVAQWRDRRLKAVSGASVRREWNLLSHACTIAVREWKWLKVNPFQEVRRPPPAKHRTRVATDEERKKLAEVANTETRRRVLDAFFFAEESAMRAGEICKAVVSGSVAALQDTKNGTARLVPLSKRALELYGGGFNLSPASIDAIWRKMVSEAGIIDLHFHDSRREAITRLSKKLDIYELARVVGHKNLNMLLVYYHRTAEELAKKL